METFDFAVVGAGFFGVAAAKTLHQLNPTKSLVVFDSGSTVGGVWSKDRLYPGLKTNNMLGTFEYPDFPMEPETFGIQPGEHISGEAMNEYLTRYAEKYGIINKIRRKTQVLSAEHQTGDEGGWILSIQNGCTESRVFSRKLVIATGLTSEPFLPRIRGEEKFGAPLFHSKDFPKHSDTIQSSKSVVVFGGTKSAFDVVYAYASQGVKVDWVIRESGHGPIWISPPYVTPLRVWLEKLVHTRLLTWLSPCIWGGVDGFKGIRKFYHETAVGRAITDAFWKVIGNDVLTLNRYDAHPETKKLKPWSNPMFVASSFSILNYPTDIFEYVRNGSVRVHIADITGLSAKAVHLSDGTRLDADALCCVTGWKYMPPVKFLPEGIDRELGLPHALDKADLFTSEEIAKADSEIFTRFPRLQDQPVQNKKFKPLLDTEGLSSSDEITSDTPLTPWTLYRFMVPPSAQLLQTRDIAFAGVLLNFTTSIIAHVQALWINAYFNNQLPADVLPTLRTNKEDAHLDVNGKSTEDIRRETLLHSRFGRWRYPAGHGDRFPDFVFDALPYVDLLVDDLGLKVRRKKGWFSEILQPYSPADYRELVEEWLENVKRVESSEGCSADSGSYE